MLILKGIIKMKTLSFEITSDRGLHMRPTQVLVEATQGIKAGNLEMHTTTLPNRVFYHNSQVTLSVMALIAAGITKGSTMIVQIADTTPEQEAVIERQLKSLNIWRQKASEETSLSF